MDNVFIIMNELKKVSEEISATNPYWTYKHDVYELPGGKVKDYYYGENHGSVMIVPLLDDGRVVLVNQRRYLRGKVSTEFPCGGLEKNEAAPNGAERELLEETGYRSSNFVKLGSYDGLIGLFKDTTHVFVADELNLVGAPTPDETEDLEIIYRRIDELETMIKRGEIWSGQTLAAWALARDYVLGKTAGRS